MALRDNLLPINHFQIVINKLIKFNDIKILIAQACVISIHGNIRIECCLREIININDELLHNQFKSCPFFFPVSRLEGLKKDIIPSNFASQVQ